MFCICVQKKLKQAQLFTVKMYDYKPFSAAALHFSSASYSLPVRKNRQFHFNDNISIFMFSGKDFLLKPLSRMETSTAVSGLSGLLIIGT